ncbi:hypothetical protein [Citrobacter youngae]|nr:hypothetical protein [Citrobacter youngae]MBK6262879.1 hypothetical protein [Citrobacter youngae]
MISDVICDFSCVFWLLGVLLQYPSSRHQLDSCCLRTTLAIFQQGSIV